MFTLYKAQDLPEVESYRVKGTVYVDKMGKKTVNLRFEQVKDIVLREAAVWERFHIEVVRGKRLLEWNLHHVNGIQRE